MREEEVGNQTEEGADLTNQKEEEEVVVEVGKEEQVALITMMMSSPLILDLPVPAGMIRRYREVHVFFCVSYSYFCFYFADPVRAEGKITDETEDETIETEDETIATEDETIATEVTDGVS